MCRPLPSPNSSRPRSVRCSNVDSRDLFDLWLALTELEVPPADIIECFAPYRPDKYTAVNGEQNLRAKLTDLSFRHDLDQLVSTRRLGYDIDAAAELVVDQVLRQLA